jgi:hypothetical protein
MAETEKIIHTDQEKGVSLTKGPKNNLTAEGINPSQEQVVFHRKPPFATLVEDERWESKPHPFKKSMRTW